MIYRFIVYILLFFVPVSLLPDRCYSQGTDSSGTKISFCDLPKYEGKTVVIEAAYSGIEEYWALNGKVKCIKVKNVELDCYKDGKPIPKQFQALFDSVHSVYWNQYLLLTVKGRYHSSNADGYGHLGSNKSKFIVEEIIQAKLVKRIKQKRLRSA